MKPVILGMCDPTYDDPDLALSPRFPGSAGQRLWRLSGMTMREWDESFIRVNLVDRREWCRKRAKLRAGELMAGMLRGRRVLVLGTSVWAALGLKRIPFFSSIGSFTLLPHPSGRNRYYNADDNRRRARRVIREILTQAAADCS